MQKLILILFIILTAISLNAQCLKCVKSQCVQAQSGSDLCTEDDNSCSIVGGYPCSGGGGGGGGGCYWDDEHKIWVCDGARVQKASIARAHELWKFWTGGRFNGATIHLPLCSDVAKVILAEHGRELVADPADHHKLVYGAVTFVIHESK